MSLAPMEDLATVVGQRNAILHGIGTGTLPEGFDPKLERHFRHLNRNDNHSTLGVGMIAQSGVETLVLTTNGTPRSIAAAEALSNFFLGQPVIDYFRRLFVPTPRKHQYTTGGGHNLRTQLRPLTLGCEIFVAESAGSLGGFVLDPQGAPEILTCQHVFEAIPSCLGKKPVYQPKVEPRTDSFLIATTNPSVGLLHDEPNEGELASAVAHHPSSIGFNEIPVGLGCKFEGCRVELPPEDFIYSSGQEVFKIGKTSGLTKGFLKSQSVFNASFEGAKRRKYSSFQFDGFLVSSQKPGESFSYPGDSGGLIYCESPDPNVVWGLGLITCGSRGRASKIPFRSSTSITGACSLRKALQLLKRTWP